MRLTEHCYAVTGLAYLPPWSVNAGFIVGDEVTIVVDTGANAAAAATIEGYARLARTGNDLMVINTEQHFDHIGGNSYFAGLGIPIYGHRDLERSEAEFDAERETFREAIACAPRREAGDADAFYAGTRLVNPDRALLDDALFDPGRCPVEVLLTPGHTPTNVSVWVPADRVLYCGDCLTSGYLPNLDEGGPAEWKQWLASIRRLERLDPAVIVPGHGPVAREDEVGAEEVRAMIDRLRGVLETAIEAGRSPTAVD